MKQKKLLLLGGLRYLLPVIEEAHRLGIYVITCDYLPGNIAHKYSDEYHNVSIIDKEAVLSLAKELEIDGILSFAVDPGVVTAAYVQEKMGLPSMGPYESVKILQNKDLFRAFLKEHGFNVPDARGYASTSEALSDTDWIKFPVIVKPTDSAGSKGVRRVDSIDEYASAVDNAMAHSISHRIIVESFIEKKGCSSDSDCFLQGGRWTFISYNAQHFDIAAANPLTPAAYTWPSTFPEQEAYLTGELQRLMDLLRMNTSVFNIETRIGIDGLPYIMECSPRGGGNRLCEMIHYATGVNLIEAQIRFAVGLPLDSVVSGCIDGCWAETILHSDKSGRFKELQVESSISKYIVERDLWVNPGDSVCLFNGASDTVGTLVFRFDDRDCMTEVVSDLARYIRVVVD